ncbi:MAG: hypothetical protein MK130_08695, partial [Puniceicoccaceae bacterium]|nr:hypothetical protein [Puniceicoccaceae bacterium]
TNAKLKLPTLRKSLQVNANFDVSVPPGDPVDLPQRKQLSVKFATTRRIKAIPIQLDDKLWGHVPRFRPTWRAGQIKGRIYIDGEGETFQQMKTDSRQSPSHKNRKTPVQPEVGSLKTQISEHIAIRNAKSLAMQVDRVPADDARTRAKDEPYPRGYPMDFQGAEPATLMFTPQSSSTSSLKMSPTLRDEFAKGKFQRTPPPQLVYYGGKSWFIRDGILYQFPMTAIFNEDQLNEDDEDWSDKFRPRLYEYRPPVMRDLNEPGDKQWKQRFVSVAKKAGGDTSTAPSSKEDLRTSSGRRGGSIAADSTWVTGDAGVVAVARAYEVGIRRYIADTGSGHHLIPKKQVKSKNLLSKMEMLRRAICFETAGGDTRCTTALGVKFPAIDEGKLVANVLDDTPAVVSIGRLCILAGYGFYWPPDEEPYFLSPSGRIIKCDVEDFIPMLDSAGLTEDDTATVAAATVKVSRRPWCFVEFGATDYLGEFTHAGGPPTSSVHRRVIMDLHTRRILSDVSCEHQTDKVSCLAGAFKEPTDVMTYVYYDEDLCAACPASGVADSSLASKLKNQYTHDLWKSQEIFSSHITPDGRSQYCAPAWDPSNMPDYPEGAVDPSEVLLTPPDPEATPPGATPDEQGWIDMALQGTADEPELHPMDTEDEGHDDPSQRRLQSQD